MRRTISPQAIAAEEDQLVQFLAGVSGMAVRRASSPQPALAPSGARLRAVRIVPGLYFGRGLQFYKQYPDSARVVPLSLPEVLQWASARTIRNRVEKAIASIGRRRRSR